MLKLPEFVETSDGPTVVDASPALLAALLEELVETLTSVGVHLDDTARPGIPESETRTKLGRFGLIAPDELVTWFSWRNGEHQRLGVSSPIPGIPLISLDASLSGYQWMLDFAPHDPPDNPEMYNFGAGPGWIHLADSTIGLAIECTQSPASAPRIRYAHEEFWYPDTSHMWRAVSLCTFVAWKLYGIREGGYTWNPDTKWWTTDAWRLHPSQRAAGFS